jgi:TonB family protein
MRELDDIKLNAALDDVANPALASKLAGDLSSADAELFELAQEVASLPRIAFREKLKADLMADIATLNGSEANTGWQIMPTLLGGSPQYPLSGQNFGMSMLAHAAMLLLVIYAGNFIRTNPRIIDPMKQLSTQVADLVIAPGDAHHGGGQGHDKLETTQGRLPESSLQPVTPPVEIRNNDPKLAIAPTIALADNVKLPDPPIVQYGDPLAQVRGPASTGIGTGPGIGDGSGPGLGIGSGGNTGGGAVHMGAGVTEPSLLYRVEPEFSPEARAAKYQGTVVLSVVVGTDGRAHDIRVSRGLGMGLDQQAINAVQKWKFAPAMYDNHAVAVYATIEVQFRLF